MAQSLRAVVTETAKDHPDLEVFYMGTSTPPSFWNRANSEDEVVTFLRSENEGDSLTTLVFGFDDGEIIELTYRT